MNTMTDRRVRPAGDADMAAIRAIAGRHGALASWPQSPDYLDLERTSGRLLIAEHGGTIAGYGGTLPRGALTHLADLFIHPDHQSAGHGKALLDQLLPVAAPVVTYASSDPRAVALYARRGLRPVAPLLYLTGPVGALTAVTATAPVTADHVASLDGQVSGGERYGQLAWMSGVDGVTVRATDHGYAFVRTTGDTIAVGPAGGRTPDDCVQVVLASLAGTSAAARAQIAVFGPHPLLHVLLAASFTIADMDTYMEHRPGSVALDRYIPHADLG